jgi:tripartite-type tricarboxylate transporter receptor subunit TctC
MHTILRLITALAMVITGIASAGAETFPSKPIKIVSPFPPGGANDIVARVIAARLSQSLGQAVVVENRPGAAGSIGSEMVARSAPDGYTLVMGTLATHGLNALINKSLPYDPVRDFTPITLIARIPIVLEANPDRGAKNVQDLIALAKSEPGKLNFAIGNRLGEPSLRRPLQVDGGGGNRARGIQGQRAGAERRTGRARQIDVPSPAVVAPLHF